MAEEANSKKPSGMSVAVSGPDGPQATSFSAHTGEVKRESADDLSGSIQLTTSRHDREKQEAAGKEAGPEADKGRPEGEKVGTEAEEAGTSTAAADLGDYDPGNAETVAKFDAHYFDGGKLSLAKLTSEFDGNAKDGKAGTLNEGTYKFLEDRLGVTREAASEIEEALLAKRQAGTSAFYAEVGGKESWDKMIAWGQGGGYTKAQAAAFNAALQRGGQDAADARDMLQSRYLHANPSGSQQIRPAVPAGRPKVNPTRDATAGAGGAPGGAAARSAEGGFASRAEMDAAFKAASKIQNRGERSAALDAYYAKKAKTRPDK